MRVGETTMKIRKRTSSRKPLASYIPVLMLKMVVVPEAVYSLLSLVVQFIPSFFAYRRVVEASSSHEVPPRPLSYLGAPCLLSLSRCKSSRDGWRVPIDLIGLNKTRLNAKNKTKSKQGRTEACKVLIAKGNDVNAMANSGGTSLMFAAGAGHTEAAEVLIAAGADVNAKLQAKPEFLEQVRM